MLRLTPFRYLRPESLTDALEMFAQHDGQVAFMGGGTDLLPNIKHRLAGPEFIIGLRFLPELQGIQDGNGVGMTIGGGVSLWALQQDPQVSRRYPALAAAASLISTPQVQRTGTIGGNICLDVRCNYYNQSEHWRRSIGYCMKKDSEICRVAPGGDRCWAVSSADTVPVLCALDASIQVVGPDGARWEPLAQFYRDDGLIPTTLSQGEVVSSVRIPPSDGFTVVYKKLRIRQSFDFPLVGAATGIRFDADGTVDRARIFLTAISPHPVRMPEAEDLLVGQRLTEDVIHAAGTTVFRAAHPMDNTEGSIPHRKRMARVYVEQALRELAGSTGRRSS